MFKKAHINNRVWEEMEVEPFSGHFECFSSQKLCLTDPYMANTMYYIQSRYILKDVKIDVGIAEQIKRRNLGHQVLVSSSEPGKGPGKVTKQNKNSENKLPFMNVLQDQL